MSILDSKSFPSAEIATFRISPSWQTNYPLRAKLSVSHSQKKIKQLKKRSNNKISLKFSEAFWSAKSLWEDRLTLSLAYEKNQVSFLQKLRGGLSWR